MCTWLRGQSSSNCLLQDRAAVPAEWLQVQHHNMCGTEISIGLPCHWGGTSQNHLWGQRAVCPGISRSCYNNKVQRSQWSLHFEWVHSCPSVCFSKGLDRLFCHRDFFGQELIQSAGGMRWYSHWYSKGHRMHKESWNLQPHWLLQEDWMCFAQLRRLCRDRAEHCRTNLWCCCHMCTWLWGEPSSNCLLENRREVHSEWLQVQHHNLCCTQGNRWLPCERSSTSKDCLWCECSVCPWISGSCQSRPLHQSKWGIHLEWMFCGSSLCFSQGLDRLFRDRDVFEQGLIQSWGQMLSHAHWRAKGHRMYKQPGNLQHHWLRSQDPLRLSWEQPLCCHREEHSGTVVWRRCNMCAWLWRNRACYPLLENRPAVSTEWLQVQHHNLCGTSGYNGLPCDRSTAPQDPVRGDCSVCPWISGSCQSNQVQLGPWSLHFEWVHSRPSVCFSKGLDRLFCHRDFFGQELIQSAGGMRWYSHWYSKGHRMHKESWNLQPHWLLQEDWMCFAQLRRLCRDRAEHCRTNLWCCCHMCTWLWGERSSNCLLENRREVHPEWLQVQHHNLCCTQGNRWLPCERSSTSKDCLWYECSVCPWISGSCQSRPLHQPVNVGNTPWVDVLRLQSVLLPRTWQAIPWQRRLWTGAHSKLRPNAQPRTLASQRSQNVPATWEPTASLVAFPGSSVLRPVRMIRMAM